MAPNIFSFIFSLSGLFCLAGAVSTFEKARHLSKNGIRVKGQVIRNDFEPSRDPEFSGVYYAVYEYEINGHSHTRRSAFGSSRALYSIGKVVELLVDPQNPESSVTADFISTWGPPLLLSISGVVLIAASIGLWFSRFS